MLRISLPWTDAGLLLTPRWRELSAAAQVASALVCVLVPVLLVLLYRYEMKLVRRAQAVALLTLRMTVIGFLLFVVFLQPIVARVATEELPARVLVAVDRSDSMKVTDPQRPPLEKLRLARALKLAGDLCTDSDLDEWLRSYQAGQEPLWVKPDEHAGDAARRRAVAEERQRRHDQVCQRVDQFSRLAVAQRVLTPKGAGLLDAIHTRQQVELVTFAREAWDLRPDQLEEALAAATPAKDAGERAALDAGTDLRLPLVRAVERADKGAGKILGVIVLTDGRHNHDGSGPTLTARAAELGQQEIPVYPVALGDRRPPPDVAVAAVQAPAAVFKDTDLPVEARIKVSGLPAQELLVELRRGDQPPVEERIQHSGVDQYYTVRFRPRLDQAGAQALTVQVRPVTGEIRSDNNSRALAVNVADDKARVLLVDGEARWEFHYLANALARDRTVQAQSIVFGQPRLGLIREEELENTGNPRLRWPAGDDDLATYDCIILGDVAPAQLSLAEQARLEKYVAERGGTLVLVAGKHAMPLAYAQPPGPDASPLTKLLPIVTPRVLRPESGFHVSPTHAGKLAPFLQLEGTAEQSDGRWGRLPPHFWAVAGPPKPGAVALADVSFDGASAATAVQTDRDREPAVIVRQNYGFGRVLFIGLDSTWRWRFKEGDTYHHRFWGQVVRWAAADKPLIAGNAYVRFGTREPVYRQGDPVEFVARLQEGQRPPDATAPAGVRLFRTGDDGKEEPAALVPLARRPAQPNVLEGRAADLPPGRYVMELAIPDLADRLNGPPGADGKPGRLRAPFTVLPGDSEEMTELAANWPLLEDVAARSGGQVFTAENVNELIALLQEKKLTRERASETKVWESWPALVLFLILLTLEWGLRKIAGLP